MNHQNGSTQQTQIGTQIFKIILKLGFKGDTGICTVLDKISEFCEKGSVAGLKQ
jgi:hypothetical protein